MRSTSATEIAGYETFRSIARMDRLGRSVPRFFGNAMSRSLGALDSSDWLRKFRALFDGEGVSSYAVARMLFIPEQRRRRDANNES
jgi:hypothetical protein